MLRPIEIAPVIQIPKRFYDDHVERDLEAPSIVHQTAKHYWIKADDPALNELKDDAEFYASMGMDYWDKSCAGLVSSARATAKAIRAHYAA